MDRQPMPNHSIEIIPESSSPPYPKHTTPSSTNQSICATKYDQPTCSTTRNSNSIGKMFFKTKLHSMLRSGTCPNVGNCSFAHREEYQIPILTSSSDWERSYKGKQCKKFYTDEGCPYGDMCSFLHDEKSKDRESVVINLSPNVGAGGNGCIQKHSNWKTRVCNKWEMTGYCPFGTKCNFAHGAEELHSHGGRVAEMETNNISSTVPDASIKAATTTVSSTISLPHANAHHIGVPGQRSNTIHPRPIQRPMHKWKGPDKISRIYGDWIDDID